MEVRPMLMHNICKTKIWSLVFLLCLLAFRTVPAEDICKQQAQSSFQLRNLGHTTSSKKCYTLCCKDKDCNVALKQGRHCYAIKCTRKDICQLIYEQLKHFEGHRVDKRENDEEGEQEFDWDNVDTSVAAGLSQLLKSKNARGTQFYGGVTRTTEGEHFPAYLLQQTQQLQELGLSKDGVEDGLYIRQNVSDYSNADNSVVNKIFRAISGYEDPSNNSSVQLQKRSAEDDDDEKENQCGKASFQKSTIPLRRKSYKYKRLTKKSLTVRSCSKKCCSAEDCVLSFLVEKNCYGIICAGEGNCHTKKDKLPRMDVKVALLEKHAKKSTPTKRTAEEGIRNDVDGDDTDDSQEEHSNSDDTKAKRHHKRKKKERRSSSRRKKGKEEDEDGEGDDDSDDQTDKRNNDDNSEDDDTKRKGRKRFKVRKVTKGEQSSESRKAHHLKRNKSKDDGVGDEDPHDSETRHKHKRKQKHRKRGKIEKEVDSDDNIVKKHSRRKDKHKQKKKHHVSSPSRVHHGEALENSGDDGEHKIKHVKTSGHKKAHHSVQDEGDIESEGGISHLKHKSNDDSTGADADDVYEGNDKRNRKNSIASDEADGSENSHKHSRKHTIVSDEDSDSENNHKHSRKNTIASDEDSDSEDSQKLSEENNIATNEDNDFESSRKGSKENSIATNEDGDSENSHKHSRKNIITTDEYSDDVKHLLHGHKLGNEKLFDDEIVGDEKDSDGDPDGPVSKGEDGDGQSKNSEEKAGETDDLKAEKSNSDETVGNEKQNDLMVAHRYYEDRTDSDDGKDDQKLDKLSKDIEEDAAEYTTDRPSRKLKDLEVAGEGLLTYHTTRGSDPSHHQREPKYQDVDGNHEFYHEDSDSLSTRQRMHHHHHSHHKGGSYVDKEEVSDDKPKHTKARKHESFEESGDASGLGEEHAHHQHQKKFHEKKARKSKISYENSKHGKNKRKSKKQKHHPPKVDKGLQREEKLLDKLENLEKKLESKHNHNHKKKKQKARLKKSHQVRKSAKLLHQENDENRQNAESHDGLPNVKHSSHHRHHHNVDAQSEQLQNSDDTEDDEESRRLESEDEHGVEGHRGSHTRHEIIVPYLEKRKHSHKLEHDDQLDREGESDQYDVSRYEKDRINIPTDKDKENLKDSLEGHPKGEDVKVFISDRNRKSHPLPDHAVIKHEHIGKQSKDEESVKYGHREDIFKEFLEFKKHQEEASKASSEHSGDGSGHLEYSGQDVLKHVKGSRPATQSSHKDAKVKGKQRLSKHDKHRKAKKKQDMSDKTKTVSGNSDVESTKKANSNTDIKENVTSGTGGNASLSSPEALEVNKTKGSIHLGAFYGRKSSLDRELTRNVTQSKTESRNSTDVSHVVKTTSTTAATVANTTLAPATTVITTETTTAPITYTTTPFTTTKPTTFTTSAKRKTSSASVANNTSEQASVVFRRPTKGKRKKKIQSVAIVKLRKNPLPKSKEKLIMTTPKSTTTPTTPIPTLSILTGDEDVEIANVPRKKPQPKIKQTVSSKKPSLKHDVQSPLLEPKGVKKNLKPQRGHLKKPKTKPTVSPKKSQKSKTYQSRPHQEKHVKQFRPTIRPHVTHKVVQDQLNRKNPTFSPVTVNGNFQGWTPHGGLQPNQGSSAGELGDLQLPRQPALINNMPMVPVSPTESLPLPQVNQQPFQTNQHNDVSDQNYFPQVPMPPFQRYGIAERTTQPPSLVLTTKAYSMAPQQFGFNGEPPFQGRDELSSSDITPQPNTVAPSIRPVVPDTTLVPTAGRKVPLSPLQIIDRILGSPTPTISRPLNRPTRPPSPMKVTGRITAGPVNQKPQEGLGVHPTKPAKFSRPFEHKQPVQKTPESHSKPQSINKPSSLQDKSQGKLKDFFDKLGQAPAHQLTTKTPETTIHKTTKRTTTPTTTTHKQTPAQPKCTVKETLQNYVLTNGRQSGEFTRLPGYPDTPTCIKECCNKPNCDVLFKSGEVCYLVHCHSPQSCKTEPSKEPLIRTKVIRIQRPQTVKSELFGFCPAENALGISWKQTKAKEFAARSCPRDARGSAKRKCDIHSRWLTPDFSNCISDDYRDVHERLNKLGFATSIKEISSRLEDITTQTIDNSLIFGGDLVKATGVLESLAAYATNTNKEKIGFPVLRNFARSASNLLDETNKQEWENIKQIIKGPSQIMNALEKFGIFAANQLPKGSLWKPVVTNNLIMSVARLSNIKKYTFPNYSIPVLRTWTTKRDSIILPGSLFNKGVVKVSSINYKTLAHLLPHPWNITNHVTFTDGFRVNSKVIASSVHPKPTQKINPPVTIILHHIKEINSAKTKCVYWDFDLNPKHGGSWSSNGCWLVMSNATVTVCQCDHLTHFAVLMHLDDERVSAKEQARENTMALMWLGIPILVVVMVGAMYTCFAWSKAPRRRHVVIMDGKPKLPDNQTIVTKTVKENFPSSPNRFLYSSYNSPSPSDLEWEHAWDFLTNSEFENWKDEDKPKIRKLMSPRKRLEKSIKKIKEKKEKQSKDPLQTSEYFSDGDSSSLYRWKHQDDYEWSKERIKCLGKGIVDVSSEASQPVDSLEEFSDDPSVGDPRAGDKSHSFDSFSPDAISSPRSGCYNPPSPPSKIHNYVFRANSKETRNYLQLSFGSESDVASEIKSSRSKYASCSSINISRPANRYSSWSSINSVKSTLNLRRIQSLDTLLGTINTKYASLTSLNTLGKLIHEGTDHKHWQVRYGIGASYSSFGRTSSSGFLDTWSSKYASSLSIATMERTNSVRTIHEHEDFEKADVMDLTTEDNDQHTVVLTDDQLDVNIPTYDMNLLSVRSPEKRKTTSLSERESYFEDDSILRCNASRATSITTIDRRNCISLCEIDRETDHIATHEHNDKLLRSMSTLESTNPAALSDYRKHVSDSNISTYDINVLSAASSPSRSCSTSGSSNSSSSLRSHDSNYSLKDLASHRTLLSSKLSLDINDSMCVEAQRNITSAESPAKIATEEFVQHRSEQITERTVQSDFVSNCIETKEDDETASNVKIKIDAEAKDSIEILNTAGAALYHPMPSPSKPNECETNVSDLEHSVSSVFDSDSNTPGSDEIIDCSCPSSSKPLKTKTTSRKSKSSQSKVRRTVTSRSATFKPSSSLRDKRSTARQGKAGASSVTRSPTKHMRSYIALRQQSRYSDQEKPCYSTHDEEEKTVSKKRKFKYTKTKSNTKAYSYLSDGMSSSNEQKFKKSVLRRTGSLPKISRPILNRREVEISRDNSKVSTLRRSMLSGSSSSVKRQVMEEIKRSMESKVFGNKLKRWKGTSKLNPKDVVDIEF